MLPDTLGDDPSALLDLFRKAAHRPPVVPHSESKSPFPISFDPEALDGPHSEPLQAPESETPHSELPTPHSRRGRPIVFDALKQHTFLRLVAVGFSSRRAARLVGVSPSTVLELAGRNMVFASGYEDAKAQAIPALAENVYHAGQRSWRASAWLLERLRPSHFGRRVALGPDSAKRREDERLRQEKKKEQLDLQKPELNDQILIRCIHRLFTDHRAQDIFEACADEFERKCAEENKAADSQTANASTAAPESTQNHPPTEPVAPPETLPIDHLSTHGGLSAPDQAQVPSQEPAACGNPQDPADNSTDGSMPDPTDGSVCDANDDTPTVIDATPPHSPNNCAPTPSANNSLPSATVTTAQTQAPQSETPPMPPSAPPNFCALTPHVPCAENPPAICAATPPLAPSRPPPLFDSPPAQSVMMTFG